MKNHFDSRHRCSNQAGGPLWITSPCLIVYVRWSPISITKATRGAGAGEGRGKDVVVLFFIFCICDSNQVRQCFLMGVFIDIEWFMHIGYWWKLAQVSFDINHVIIYFSKNILLLKCNIFRHIKLNLHSDTVIIYELINIPTLCCLCNSYS